VVVPFSITTVKIPQKETGAREGSSFRSHVGRYETWICAQCGYTEWYAMDHEQLLERLSHVPGSGVRVVEG
jgi:ribosomal protein S27AE